jgi:hypothetical protein
MGALQYTLITGANAAGKSWSRSEDTMDKTFDLFAWYYRVENGFF